MECKVARGGSARQAGCPNLNRPKWLQFYHDAYNLSLLLQVTSPTQLTVVTMATVRSTRTPCMLVSKAGRVSLLPKTNDFLLNDSGRL